MLNLSSSELLVSTIPDNCLSRTSQESTVRDLSLYDFQVDNNQVGEIAALRLQAEPRLPGVILMEEEQLSGMISRQRFLEYLSRPFGRELFLKRSLKTLYQFACTDFLVLRANTTVVEASSRALQRPTDIAYEPIVVEIEPNVYRLLDVHHLLVAQSQIHQLANNLLQELYLKLETAHKELELQASLDALTQVANRRKFDQYLAEKWFQMSKEQKPISIIMADIDCFKGYNDTYGHQAGDQCLKQVALTINQTAQMITKGNNENLVARYGGEEFAIVLPKKTQVEAVFIAEKIRSQVKSLDIINQGSYCSEIVTLSLGVATTLPELGGSIEKLISVADKALYQAKATGRDRVICS
ncbi:MAG: GGDEF domain-containing protein [Okeania sp. SIO2F4]|uniref:GGDEF domain-containing protein n=1 Tax=Okeania sp. SIO2F4 TaxID=2607790 RepID=UPI00142A3117|nr:GGDEF domain-containing protein [Okeania sp. SIO2F4]NES04281.1 GGDEF domain-containing protein [Okeania sp. SIO2F4]